jgi:hypothetical protein
MMTDFIQSSDLTREDLKRAITYAEYLQENQPDDVVIQNEFAEFLSNLDNCRNNLRENWASNLCEKIGERVTDEATRLPSSQNDRNHFTNTVRSEDKIWDSLERVNRYFTSNLIFGEGGNRFRQMSNQVHDSLHTTGIGGMIRNIPGVGYVMDAVSQRVNGNPLSYEDINTLPIPE